MRDLKLLKPRDWSVAIILGVLVAVMSGSVFAAVLR